VLANENSDASPGVQLVAQDAIDGLVGGTAYLKQIVDMEHFADVSDGGPRTARPGH
jgi:hypothetical protein